MFRNTAHRRGRWMVVGIYLAILSLFVTPVQGIYAQDDNSLYLPMLNTVEGNTDNSELVVSESISPESQRAVLEFWTREQIAAAQPLEIQIDIGPSTAEEAALALSEVVGIPSFVAGGAAAPDADRVAQAAYPEDWATLDVETAVAAEADSPSATDGTSERFTSYMVNNIDGLWKVYPHKWVGRFSFQTPSGSSFCTGTSLPGNVVVTAAKCLYDTTNNRWYTNRVFTPAYRNGIAPYGSFPTTSCWVLTAWVNLTGTYRVDSWARYDVGVCKVGNNSAGVTLNNAVGSMGYGVNHSYVQHYHLLGYATRYTNGTPVPSSPGQYLRVCVAESFSRTTDTRGMGCSLAGGITGGPWMVGYAPNVVSGYADGVYSIYSTTTRDAFGARFTSNNIVPLCRSAGC